MTPGAAAGPRETRLGLEWELWVIDQLVDGAELDDVVAALADAGLDAADAHAQVAAIVGSPSFARLRRRTAPAAMAAQLVAVRHALAEVTAVDRCASIDRDAFRERYWERSRPLLLTEAARAMRAVERWSFASLGERFGEIEVEVNVRRTEAARRSQTEAITARIRLGEFLDHARTSHGNERYLVSRNGLLDRPELAALWDDLAPVPEFLVPPVAPRGASLWIGPAGTRTPAHFDPHGVLLVQIQGTKRIRLVAPDHLRMFEALDGYHATVDLDDPAALPPGAVLTTNLTPGEALFVPVGWFHEVAALEPSISLSLLCFGWPNDFHWLRPR